VRLASLALADFRNYAALELEPRPGLNLFIGPNAQGKSNLLEAVALLGIGKSFRGARDAEMIRNGAQQSSVRGSVSRSEGENVLACGIARVQQGARKTFLRDGRSIAYGRFLGTLRVVTFVPSDLQLISGAPGIRRAFLNTTLSQQDPSYYRELARYQRALRQKNALLGQSNGEDWKLLDVYNETLADAGAQIMLHRRRFVASLSRNAADAHARWAAGEKLAVRYAPNIAMSEGETHEMLRERVAQRLEQIVSKERSRGVALAGPHRDDVTLDLDGRSLGIFGSQGQQRTAVLALKVAEYDIMRDRCGEAPLLLLDDVLSELDQQRAHAFLEGVGDYEQAYVTATHRPERLPTASAAFAVEAARIRPC
jgi:DNA replication and repair protein RecF